MRLQLTEKQLAQLRERIRKNSEVSDDGCWLWMGAIKKNRNGMEYGRIGFRIEGEYHKSHRNPRNWSAHVVSFAAFNGGQHTPGMVRAHTCHRPYCVNPDHIVECTQRVNLSMSRHDGRLKRAA